MNLVDEMKAFKETIQPNAPRQEVKLCRLIFSALIELLEKQNG